MEHNTIAKDLEKMVAQCEDSLQWSKNSKLVKHYKKIHAAGVLPLMGLCVFTVLSAPSAADLNTISMVLWGVMVFMISAIPACFLTYIIARVGASVLKCKHYAIWEDCIRDLAVKSDREDEVKHARHKFMNIVKANNIDGMSHVIQRLKKLEEQTGLSKYFWNTCRAVVENSPDVQKIDIQKEWGDFVEVAATENNVKVSPVTKILKL